MLSLTTFSSPARSLAISSTTGATIRHGPHHGAQKSTSTGFSDSSTSAWKLLSVTSATLAMLAPYGLVRVTSKSIAGEGPRAGTDIRTSVAGRRAASVGPHDPV